MLSFKQFFSESNGSLDIPVVSMSEEFVGKIDSINEELDLLLTENLINPYIGWVNASNTLAPHGITLPRVLFKDIQEGVEIVALNLSESEEEHYFYYEYSFVKEGYHSFASIVNESELEDLLKEE